MTKKAAAGERESLHERIIGTLRETIVSGTLRPGDRIPTEQELVDSFHCSRMTVNKAISTLVAAGLIERRKKAGSFVTRPHIHFAALAIPDIRLEIESRGEPYSLKLLSRGTQCGRTVGTDLMMVPRNSRVLYLKCLHLAGDSVFALEERYISLRAVPEASDADFSLIPPGTWLLNHVPWDEAEHRISAASASRSARLLGVSRDRPCLVLERRTWRGADTVTYVHQTYPRRDFDLVARFGSPAAPLNATRSRADAIAQRPLWDHNGSARKAT